MDFNFLLVACLMMLKLIKFSLHDAFVSQLLHLVVFCSVILSINVSDFLTAM